MDDGAGRPKPQKPPMPQKPQKAGRGGMRWGLLTLLFLGVALTCILVSNSHGSYTGLTLLGLVVGFAGAGYCTYQGLKGFTWLPR